MKPKTIIKKEDLHKAGLSAIQRELMPYKKGLRIHKSKKNYTRKDKHKDNECN